MSVCKGCHKYKTFKKDCWFYWDEKTECSKFQLNDEDNEHYKIEEEND